MAILVRRKSHSGLLRIFKVEKNKNEALLKIFRPSDFPYYKQGGEFNPHIEDTNLLRSEIDETTGGH